MRPDIPGEPPRIALVSGDDLSWSVDSGNGVLTVYDNRDRKFSPVFSSRDWSDIEERE